MPNFLLVADVIANLCCCVRCYDTIFYHYYCFVTNVCHSVGLICGWCYATVVHETTLVVTDVVFISHMDLTIWWCFNCTRYNSYWYEWLMVFAIVADVNATVTSCFTVVDVMTTCWLILLPNMWWLMLLPCVADVINHFVLWWADVIALWQME